MLRELQFLSSAFLSTEFCLLKKLATHGKIIDLAHSLLTIWMNFHITRYCSELFAIHNIQNQRILKV